MRFQILPPSWARGMDGRLGLITFCFQRCCGCGRDIGGFFAVLYPFPYPRELKYPLVPDARCPPYHAACLVRRAERAQRKLLKEQELKANEWWSELQRRIAAMSVDELWRMEDLIESALANRKGRP
jgi:hypothetical protein